MGLAHCQAGGLSFSLAWAEVSEPSQVTPALRQMRQALAARLSARDIESQPLHVPGMTPNPEAQLHVLAGAGSPETGQARLAQVALFTRGLRVYQAVMMGEKRNASAWESFVGSLMLDF